MFVLITYLLTTHYSESYKCIAGMHVCCLFQQIVLYCIVLTDLAVAVIQVMPI